MKKKDQQSKYSFYDILGVLILSSVLAFGIYFSYGLVKSFLDEEQSIISNQVWCENCQTYHDKQTAEEENQSQKLIWCVNCNKYHAPGQE